MCLSVENLPDKITEKCRRTLSGASISPESKRLDTERPRKCPFMRGLAAQPARERGAGVLRGAAARSHPYG
jgi:hypothetical protein